MVTQLYCQHEIHAAMQPHAGINCDLSQNYLCKLGFVRLDSTADPDFSVYRYCTPKKSGKGFDLIFSGEFGIITVEEFATDPVSGSISFRNTIVGMFQIECQEDLHFIFSRNIRLKHTFKTALKRVSLFNKVE
jgi:hypothetical protein